MFHPKQGVERGERQRKLLNHGWSGGCRNGGANRLPGSP